MTLEERLIRDEAVEACALRIKKGETDLIPELWNLVSKSARRKAFVHLRKNREKGRYAGGLEFDDLFQECFLCMLSALKSYSDENCTENRGFAAYLNASMEYHCMNLILKRPGAPKYGTRNLLDQSISLDAPLGHDKDDFCLADIIPAPDSMSAIEQRIWLDELREALETALANIKTEQAAALRRRYASSAPPLTPEEKQLADRGLANLRSNSATRRILQDFVCYL